MDELEDLPSWTPMMDVSGLSFKELMAGDNSALDGCVQRLIKALDDPDGIISAFQNFSS
jgi:hypothetical protein